MMNDKLMNNRTKNRQRRRRHCFNSFFSLSSFDPFNPPDVLGSEEDSILGSGPRYLASRGRDGSRSQEGGMVPHLRYRCLYEP